MGGDELPRHGSIAGAVAAGALRCRGRHLSHRFLRDRCQKVAVACGSGFLAVFVDTPLLEIEARRVANDRNSVRQHIRDAVFQHTAFNVQATMSRSSASAMTATLRNCWRGREKTRSDAGWTPTSWPRIVR